MQVYIVKFFLNNYTKLKNVIYYDNRIKSQKK
jgi:hypothetical protein